MKRILKRLALFLGVSVFLFLAFNYESLFYGISQGIGQIKILNNTRPVSEILADPAYPDSLKAKIKLIEEIKSYAIDSLGISKSDSYTAYYEQHGKPILWVVTACPKYKLEAFEWNFPIAGSFSYKGFFEREKAEQEKNKLKSLGFDTDIDEVSAWSTLGWLNDPILSSMLKRKPGSLANLIIHELTHGTLYVKSDVQFNENLASFVGDKGAIRFLAFKYGTDSPEMKEYIDSRNSNKLFTEKVLECSSKLSGLYNSFTNKETVSEKERLKASYIAEIKDTLSLYVSSGKLDEEFENMNNTFFMDFIRYHVEVEEFESEFIGISKGDLKSYIHYLKEKYSSII